jgi:hypothetical protein
MAELHQTGNRKNLKGGEGPLGRCPHVMTIGKEYIRDQANSPAFRFLNSRSSFLLLVN